MHMLETSPVLEELRRQLRDGEITYQHYQTALRTIPEPAEQVCATPGCESPAHSVQDGVMLCAGCGLKRRSARRR